MIKYLSPTSLNQWEKDTEEWVFQRIVKGSKFIQTIPMAIGSRFDDLIKEHLVKEFKLDQESATGVEVDDPVIIELGDLAFYSYLNSDSYHYLMNMLHRASEVDLIGDFTGEIEGIPVRGKPDLAFVLENTHVLDWKTGGFQSQASPVMGYVGHKKFFYVLKQGIMCNMESPLLSRQSSWIDQLTTYNLLLKATPPFIGLIDQLTHRNSRVTCVSHREEISLETIELTKRRYTQAWSYISQEWYFPTVTKMESDAMVEALFKRKGVFEGDSVNDLWYKKMMGR